MATQKSMKPLIQAPTYHHSSLRGIDGRGTNKTREKTNMRSVHNRQHAYGKNHEWSYMNGGKGKKDFNKRKGGSEVYRGTVGANHEHALRCIKFSQGNMQESRQISFYKTLKQLHLCLTPLSELHCTSLRTGLYAADQNSFITWPQ